MSNRRGDQGCHLAADVSPRVVVELDRAQITVTILPHLAVLAGALALVVVAGTGGPVAGVAHRGADLLPTLCPPFRPATTRSTSTPTSRLCWSR